MNGFIYKITNDINDKVYIGKTLLLYSRKKREEETCLTIYRRKFSIRTFYIWTKELLTIQEEVSFTIYRKVLSIQGV